MNADSVCIFNSIAYSGRSVSKIFSYLLLSLLISFAKETESCFRICRMAKMNVVEKPLEPRIHFTSFFITSMPSTLVEGYSGMCAVNAGQFATVLWRQHCVKHSI